MKLNNHSITALLLTAAALLGSCGVGNDKDEAGSLTAFNLQGGTYTLNGAVGVCPAGAGTNLGRVWVFGGTAPYDVYSTIPDVVTTSKARVEHPEESFDLLVVANGCFTVTIVVVDKLGRQATLTATGVKGS
ncbi:MAG: hypothetical protein JNN03_01620 [Rubrivivax sp.]|nr:hypothetical protein [Rubrivivax sp.]